MTKPTPFTGYSIDNAFQFDDGLGFKTAGRAVIFERGPNRDPLIFDARPAALPDLTAKANAFVASRPDDGQMMHKALREIKAEAVPA